MKDSGKLPPDPVTWAKNSHTAIELGAPSLNSPAIKSLFGLTSINGLIYPVYWWTQLTYSDSSWNDDSLIHINSNTTTMLDTAGNTVLVGTAVGVQAIGWEVK